MVAERKHKRNLKNRIKIFCITGLLRELCHCGLINTVIFLVNSDDGTIAGELDTDTHAGNAGGYCNTTAIE
jgi:hypothetical protein